MFLDGQSLGTIDRNANFSEAIDFGSGAASLQIGGRANDNDKAIKGSVDLLRVSARALTPAEFLNAEPSEPPETSTAHTVGYWKLDADDMLSSSVDDRLRFNGSSLEANVEQFGRTVRRPDASTNFVGSASSNAGSVRVNGLLTSHGAATWTQVDRSFSLEGWIRLEKHGTKPFPQVLLSTEREAGGLRGDWVLSLADERTFRLLVRDQAGYVTVSRTLDVPTKFALPGEWRHLALVHDVVLNVWRLYLDGEEIGSADAMTIASPALSTFPGSLMVGSGLDGGTFDGLLDTWRLSCGVRTPDDFLYMAVPKGTLIVVR